MEYNLRIGAETQTAEVDLTDADRLRIRLNGKEYEAFGTVISEHYLHLNVDGMATNAFIVKENNGRKTVVLNGMPYTVEDVDSLSATTRRAKGPGTLPQEVTPPMPSVVVSLLVREGDHVSKGDAVLVVTAMKMETTLTAPYDGEVQRINVAEGDKVMPGEILVEIHK